MWTTSFHRSDHPTTPMRRLEVTSSRVSGGEQNARISTSAVRGAVIGSAGLAVLSRLTVAADLAQA